MKYFAAAMILMAAPASADQGTRTFDMLAFFTGRSHADNLMKVALSHPKKLIVDSVGGRNKEGEFVLIDTVREEGKPDRKRTWVMKQVGPGHYSGALSDAVGPVDVVVSGTGATIRYTMKDGGLKIVQQLQLQDAKTLSNRTEARKYGMKFATVDGTIHKLD